MRVLEASEHVWASGQAGGHRREFQMIFCQVDSFRRPFHSTAVRVQEHFGPIRKITIPHVENVQIK